MHSKRAALVLLFTVGHSIRIGNDSGASVVAPQAAKSTTVVYDATGIALGMSKTEVRAALRGAVKVMELNSAWSLWKGGAYLGRLTFSEDRVVRAERDISPFDLRPSAAYAAATYNAIADMIRAGKSTCTLSVDSTSGTSGESRAAYLRCGDRYIVFAAKRLRDHGETGEIKEGAGPLPTVEAAEP